MSSLRNFFSGMNHDQYEAFLKQQGFTQLLLAAQPIDGKHPTSWPMCMLSNALFSY